MGRSDRAAGGEDGDGGMGTVNLPGAAHSPAFLLCSDADPFPETGEVTILLSTQDLPGRACLSFRKVLLHGLWLTSWALCSSLSSLPGLLTAPSLAPPPLPN